MTSKRAFAPVLLSLGLLTAVAVPAADAGQPRRQPAGVTEASFNVKLEGTQSRTWSETRSTVGKFDCSGTERRQGREDLRFSGLPLQLRLGYHKNRRIEPSIYRYGRLGATLTATRSETGSVDPQPDYCGAPTAQPVGQGCGTKTVRASIAVAYEPLKGNRGHTITLDTTPAEQPFQNCASGELEVGFPSLVSKTTAGKAITATLLRKDVLNRRKRTIVLAGTGRNAYSGVIGDSNQSVDASISWKVTLTRIRAIRK